MTASNVLDELVQAGSQIDNQWSMFIVVHLGLFWFFFLVHRPLLVIERAIALFAYGAFIFINGNALKNTYALLEAMRSDLVTQFSSELAHTPKMATVLASVDYGDRADLITMTHGGAFLGVSVFLIFRNVMIRRYARHFPRYVQPEGGLID